MAHAEIALPKVKGRVPRWLGKKVPGELPRHGSILELKQIDPADWQSGFNVKKFSLKKRKEYNPINVQTYFKELKQHGVPFRTRMQWLSKVYGGRGGYTSEKLYEIVTGKKKSSYYIYPFVKNAPPAVNRILEETYRRHRKQGDSKAAAAIAAWKTVRKAGYTQVVKPQKIWEKQKMKKYKLSLSGLGLQPLTIGTLKELRLLQRLQSLAKMYDVKKFAREEQKKISLKKPLILGAGLGLAGLGALKLARQIKLIRKVATRQPVVRKIGKNLLIHRPGIGTRKIVKSKQYAIDLEIQKRRVTRARGQMTTAKRGRINALRLALLSLGGIHNRAIIRGLKNLKLGMTQSLATANLVRKGRVPLRLVPRVVKQRTKVAIQDAQGWSPGVDDLGSELLKTAGNIYGKLGLGLSGLLGLNAQANIRSQRRKLKKLGVKYSFEENRPKQKYTTLFDEAYQYGLIEGLRNMWWQTKKLWDDTKEVAKEAVPLGIRGAVLGGLQELHTEIGLPLLTEVDQVPVLRKSLSSQFNNLTNIQLRQLKRKLTSKITSVPKDLKIGLQKQVANLEVELLARQGL